MPFASHPVAAEIPQPTMPSIVGYRIACTAEQAGVTGTECPTPRAWPISCRTVKVAAVFGVSPQAEAKFWISPTFRTTSDQLIVPALIQAPLQSRIRFTQVGLQNSTA